MIDSAVFIGEPLEYGPIKIYPPKVKDVATNPMFNYYHALLTISQEELEDQYVEQKKDITTVPTPFQYILELYEKSEQTKKIIKEAFYFFIHEEIEVLSETSLIMVGNAEEVIKNLNSLSDLILIREQDYFNFQNIVREACGEEKVELPNPNEHPKIKAMKAKARYRDRIKAKSKNGITFSTTLTSICCMGIGITPLNIGELSYASLGALMEQYQEKEKYQLDIDSLLAGADSKKIKPKYWIRNLD